MIYHFKYLQVSRSQLFVAYGGIFRLFRAETRRVRARLQVQERLTLLLGFRSRSEAGNRRQLLGPTFPEAAEKRV